MMTNIYEIVKNIALILFPFLCYTIYVAYCNEINKKESNVILSLTMFISMYMCYTSMGNNHIQSLLLDIPLLIAYIKNKKDCIVFMSTFAMIIYHINYGISLYFSVVEYTIYYIASLLIKENKKKNYVIMFLSLKTIFYILELIYTKELITYSNVVTILEFIISSVVVILLINKSDSIINLNVSIKELEKELQMRKSLFNIAHEIKNPLSVCKGYLEMLDFKNNDHEKYIPIIQNELNRSITLMNDMLHLNQIKINPDYMDINVLLEDIKLCIKPLIDCNKIKVDIEISNEELYIYADYTRIKHVFIDVIKCSVESLANIKNDRFISINVKLNNNKIITTIKDNGTCMKKSDFNNTYYIPNSNNKALGMTLANEIIKCHNGKIKYKSSNKKGNMTRIILPAC